LIATRDFHRLSLDAIASQAGVTKGAIYGHFESKDALLMAALATRPAARPDTMVWPKRKGTTKQRLRQLGEAILAQQTQADAASAAEFMLYAFANEELKAQSNELLQASCAGMEAKILALFAPDELSMPVSAFALLLSAMIIPSLMFTRALSGDALDRETVLEIFEGFAGGPR
jgi:AcrR family transcriptional regulator